MMRGALRDNGLAIFFGLAFLASLVGQSIAGHDAYNQQEVDHASLLDEEAEPLSYGRYLTSSHFAQAVAENWQSEYLQFVLFIMATIWLFQRGSTESKVLGQPGTESDEDQKVGPHAEEGSPRWAKAGGLRTALLSNSLLIVMGLIFVASWFAQSVSGWSEFNSDQIEHEAERVTWAGYIGSSDFWEATLQNWQSEFLAVGSIAVLTVYLRQRGSSQSKPVGAAHMDTGAEG